MKTEQQNHCPQCGYPIFLILEREHQPLPPQTFLLMTNSDGHTYLKEVLQRDYVPAANPKPETEKMSPTTTPPTKADLRQIGYVTRTAARRLILPKYLLEDGPKIGSAIRALLAATPHAHFSNARDARLAMRDACHSAVRKSAVDWRGWYFAVEEQLLTRGVRDEISSLEPFRHAWTTVADALDDEIEDARTNLGRTEQPTTDQDEESDRLPHANELNDL